MIKYCDNHAHLNFPDFDQDRAETIKRAEEKGVAVINVGVDKKSSKEALELAKQNDYMYAIVGEHPTHEEGDFDYDFYLNLARDEKTVGIGECGLDYFRTPKSKENQIKIFKEQIRLAAEVGKPLMLHIREAYGDAFEIIKSEAEVSGNVHFFAGTWEEGKKFLDLGFTLSFTGVITFTKDYDEVVKNTPLDRLLSETDCPYVAPVPFRGKRNEPAYVVEVVKKMAQIKGLEESQVAEALIANSNRLFGLNL